MMSENKYLNKQPDDQLALIPEGNSLSLLTVILDEAGISGSRCSDRDERLYDYLIRLRETFNRVVSNYEIILEDEWYKDDGYTAIEYQLRSLDTFELLTFAQDIYNNHQDEHGVWHLGDYQYSEWRVPPAELTAQFTTFFDRNIAIQMCP